MAVNKSRNPERDAKILEMVKTMSYTDVATALGLGNTVNPGRSIVAGVVKRNDGETRPKGVLSAENSKRSSEMKRERGASFTFGEGPAAPKPPTPISTPGRQPLPAYAREKAPPTAVPLLERTGCAFIFGSGAGVEPYLYCDASRCSIIRHGKAERTAYCAEHYRRMRATVVFRVLEDS